jgi:hypothetical protein
MKSSIDGGLRHPFTSLKGRLLDKNNPLTPFIKGDLPFFNAKTQRCKDAK